MPTDQSPKQIWDLYDKIPRELQTLIFSEEFENKITDICTKNKIENDINVTELVQRVLLGLLLPDNFQEELKNNLQIDTNVAEILTAQVNKTIFGPVKIYLNKLYNKNTKDKIINNNSDKDTYREPIK